MKRYARELSVLGALAIILVVLAVAAPSFFQLDPLRSHFTREAPTLLVACGAALVIICRQIDISVGSQFGVCGVVVGLLAGAHVPLPLCALASIAAGAGLGAINGLLVARLRLPSIVVTLATLVIWKEGLRLWQQGQFINLPPNAVWFGLPLAAGQTVELLAALLGLAEVLQQSNRPDEARRRSPLSTDDAPVDGQRYARVKHGYP